MSNLFTNRAKQRFANGEKLTAAWVQLGSSVAAEIMAQAGYDMLVIDCEHAPIDPSTLLPIMQAVSGYETTPIVRAPWNDLVAIKRILDCGAMGIHVPYVNNKEEAIRAVRACKYPPLGNRGIAGSPRAAGFGKNRLQSLHRANDEILVILAIETPEGLANLDEMMDVEGVDGIFIGPMDYSTSSGHFANPSHPDAQADFRLIEEKVLKRGNLLLGTVAGSPQAAKELYDRGYSYVIFGGDVNSLVSDSYKRVQDMKELWCQET